MQEQRPRMNLVLNEVRVVRGAEGEFLSSVTHFSLVRETESEPGTAYSHGWCCGMAPLRGSSSQPSDIPRESQLLVAHDQPGTGTQMYFPWQLNRLATRLPTKPKYPPWENSV